MSNLQLRLLSALVLIPVVFGAIIMGGLAFRIFIGAAFAISLYEWGSLSLKTDRKISFLLFGLVYIPVCFYQFYDLRTGFDDGLYLVLMMLIVVWAADTGAYFIGRKFGKHKMAPTISPNKSWEGLGGSVLFAGFAFTGMYYLSFQINGLIASDLAGAREVTPIVLFLIGGFLGYIGQAGDLLESMLKRRAAAKDSGHLIPGHGGILDRVDSILLIAPFFVFLATYVF